MGTFVPGMAVVRVNVILTCKENKQKCFINKAGYMHTFHIYKSLIFFVSLQVRMTFTLTSAIPGTNVPIFGVMSLLGGFLLQFTMGSFYSFGNMATYMVGFPCSLYFIDLY